LTGLRGSGKSNAARYIASLDPKSVLVYDPMDQYPEYDRIQPKKTQYPDSVEEFARIAKREHLDDASKHKWRLLVIDEAKRIAPNNYQLHPFVAKMNAEHRHWPLGIVWVSQRPRQLHFDVVNLVDYMLVWRLPGATDGTFLDDTAKGLGNTVLELAEFEYVFVDKDRRFHVMPPLPNMDREKGA